MTRKINNSYELGQSNAPTDGGDMLKTRADGTIVLTYHRLGMVVGVLLVVDILMLLIT